MVDVIKSLDFEYVAANPGSSFRGIHESIVNYGGNTAPEFITCCHEESSVAMAHGYFKAEGKPMAVLCHGTVGLQHAAMAIYNAYCDRVPVYIMAGNTLDATLRRPGVEWAHSVQDAAAMVRDFIKWDDLPVSLPHFAESAVRAYKIAMTPPMMPVLLVVDGGLQEDPISPEISARLRMPKLTRAVAAAGRLGRGRRGGAAARRRAEPGDRRRSRCAHAGRHRRARSSWPRRCRPPVIDQGGRMNFPSRHPLNQSSDSARQLVANADVILGLELTDFWGTVERGRAIRSCARRGRSSKPGTKLISITAVDLFTKGNYQDFQRYPEVDLAMAADAEATLPALIEACKRLITADRRTRVRRARASGWPTRTPRRWTRARAEAAYAWDASPISTARLTTELWAQIKNEDWALVAESGIMQRLDARGSGPSTSTISRSAARAAPASATARRRRSARRWRTRSTAGCRSPSRATATSCTRPASGGRRRITGFRCSRSCTTTAPTIRRSCTCSAWPTGTSAASRARTSARRSTTRTSTSRRSRRAWACTRRDRSRTRTIWGRRIKRAIEVVKRGEPSLIDVVTQPR